MVGSIRTPRALTWIHLTFLLAVTLMPFSTGPLAQDTTYRLSMAVYWLNLFALGAVLFIGLEYADQAGLLSDETTEDMRAAMKRRIVVYQISCTAAGIHTTKTTASAGLITSTAAASAVLEPSDPS